ncbi:TPA: hypothetical protein N0F65_006374 [Lagenidium giganteum]|uniref:glutaminase n=1 Tax=Lagenidium giganteum TaxID=4803 RepID=A0AAV2YZK9_9STRA|nr:TPA: hypothetical protein N0F65_006374 [Lagenidium giganteum]
MTVKECDAPVVMRVGVLALQGAFQEHIDMLNTLSVRGSNGQDIKVEAFAVRLPEELQTAQALLLPGGESTTIGKVATRWGLVEPLKQWVADKRPIWGTCAGMIMLSTSVKHGEDGGQTLIGGLDVQVSRNFFGSQVRSFEMGISGPPGYGEEPYNAVFIRGPAIVSVGESIEPLSQMHCANPADGSDPTDVIVAARKENILVTAFHPELTSDTRWHRYFVESVALPTLKL